MLNPLINKLGMFLIVITVPDKFSELIAQVPALVKLVASFKILIGDINKVSQESGLGTAGKTKVKQSAASNMAEKVASLVGCPHAYAAGEGDEDLMEQPEISETEVIHTRDAERAAFCTKRVDLLEQKKAGSSRPRTSRTSSHS